MSNKKQLAFTLVEILIVVLIFSILIIGVILLLDPRTLVNRGVDAQRKADLTTFKKQMEEFYNDRGCYPRPNEVCFSGGTNGDLTNKTSCIICGKEATSPLSPLTPSYMEKVPCDPTYPTYVYLYVVSSTSSCPTSYALYAKLAVPRDNESIKLGCAGGACGVAPNYGYDYGVTSPNTKPSSTSTYWCLSNISFSCNTCGTYDECLENPARHCQTSKIYATGAICRSTTGAP